MHYTLAALAAAIAIGTVISLEHGATTPHPAIAAKTVEARFVTMPEPPQDAARVAERQREVLRPDVSWKAFAPLTDF